MNDKEIKLLVEKGIKGSIEKQNKLFFKNKKTTKMFNYIIRKIGYMY